MAFMSISIICFKSLRTLLRLYKRLERVFIRLFLPFVKKIIINEFQKVGITVNGTEPWDIKVLDDEFFVFAANEAGLLGMGEAYLQGFWECEDLVEMFAKIISSEEFYRRANRFGEGHLMSWFNLQDRKILLKFGSQHYDSGLRIFETILDSNMLYSCGYWRRHAKNLEEAQLHKMELICKKLNLENGMRVLDIGCGFGGLARFMAIKYKVSVVGYTASSTHADWAKESCRGLSSVEIIHGDYRDIKMLEPKFDRVVSIEMIEHVGPRNYKQFFEIVKSSLVDDGLFLLSCSCFNHNRSPRYDPFIHKYLFPYACLPYYLEIMQAVENTWIIEDLQNIGADFYLTMMAWLDKFQRTAQMQETVEAYGGIKVYRLWKLYLSMFAGGSKCRIGQLWILVLSKNGVPGGYLSSR